MTVLAKQPSEDLIQMIKVAGDSLLSFGDLWGSIKKKGASEGFSEKELQEMLRPYLKEKLDSKKVWYLFHAEEQKDRSKQQYQNRTNISTNVAKKELEQSQADERQKEIITVPVKDSTQFYEELEADEAEEEYKKETEQFKDGRIETFPPLQEEEVFEWLGKRDDKIKCFYFGSCGTGFIKANILKNLENSGIKTFRRLYFEV